MNNPFDDYDASTPEHEMGLTRYELIAAMSLLGILASGKDLKNIDPVIQALHYADNLIIGIEERLAGVNNLN